MDGNFEGVGIQFQIIDDTLNVIQTVTGCPAEKVGVLPGDKIIYVEDSLIAGVGTKNKTIQSLLRGPKGSVVNVPPYGGRKHPEQQFIQVDTKNILFICGGAFDGLEKIIESRMDQSSIGFNSELHEKSDESVGEMFHKALPQDLIKFGLIPEFVGRVPVVVALDSLDEDALVRILKEPKNAIVKQYQALFGLDEVELEFRDDAVREIAHKSYERKTGARGLRSILESVMNETMYEIPSDDTISKCIITKEAVEGTSKPLLEYRTDAVSKKAQ